LSVLIFIVKEGRTSKFLIIHLNKENCGANVYTSNEHLFPFLLN